MAAQRANEWTDRIRRLLRQLNLSQAGLAERLGVSPPTVSRWLKGRHEPTAESYIALGNLCHPPEGIYFWERAGLDASGLLDASFQRAVSSLRASLRDFKLVAGKKISGSVAGKENEVAVAIPLLNATAYGDRIPPHENVNLSEAKVESILLAPLSWCPHPENMIGIHLDGDSMLPIIAPGSILFVDTAAKDRDQLHQRITVITHRDLGFKVARFQRIGGADLLVSANHKYAPVDVSNASKWKIFGEVLWWVSRDANQHLDSGAPGESAQAS
ncbi:MAG TPA: XRE family transcriptional regulator [Terracidiphilus sp.]|jgi:transcriptional regulator with XRE-family HTH domain|nr:XRE family transcriptional regulator [Terracidiphilus sp.]